jgi:predicted AlkP superfamily pyrophosphatase or phosphodiesterase
MDNWIYSGAFAVLLVSGCAARVPASAVPQQQPDSRASGADVSASAGGARRVAPVTVAIVIDQLAAWIAVERLPKLPSSGGFARLIREGTWYQDMRFAHAITETAPGHASLYSGRVPREHGIVANELLNGNHGVGILIDPDTKLVTADGIRTEAGSSAVHLRSMVVADWFKAAQPTSKVYSFSVKDRGAIPGGGQHPDLTLWFDVNLGQFVSSTAFVQTLPDWLAPSVSQSAILPRLAQAWTPLDSAWVAQSIGADNQAGEGNLANYGVTFPHLAAGAGKPYAAFRANPESDRVVLELGLAALDHTPVDTSVLLALSLSANDYIGHIFGPDSWEAWDELLRLDKSLGWFFSELDRRRGADLWSAVLSADHGVAPLPEVSKTKGSRQPEGDAPGKRPQLETHRVLPAAFEKVARQAAKKALGKGDWISGFVDPYLSLSDDAKKQPADKQSSLMRQLTEAFAKEPCVAKLYRTAEIPSTCPPDEDESMDALVCRSVRPNLGGDIFIALRPGCFFDTGYVPGFGTSHGNPLLYDRSVPLLVRSPGQVGSGEVIAAQVPFSEFANQLEKLLHIH